MNLNKNDSINKAIIYNKIDEDKENKDYIIVFLDIDGGVNIYKNGKISPFFNLYDIKDIKQDEKNKKFFDMGYSYFIKYNLNYCVISSDHGCYVLKIN